MLRMERKRLVGPKPYITVRHNIEVAHRLYLLPGKCENIHGHSMWVELTLFGELDKNGILAGLDFGDVKKEFRHYLDSTFDHRLLLNEQDPWAQLVRHMPGDQPLSNDVHYKRLPGLQPISIGDPTTENLARIIAHWGATQFNLPTDVVVHETAVNSAGFFVGRESED